MCHLACSHQMPLCAPHQHALRRLRAPVSHTSPSSTFFSTKAGASRAVVTDRISEVPSKNDKQASNRFGDQYRPYELLKGFQDSLSDAEYSELRCELVENLYLLTCTQRDPKHGEGQAQNTLKAAIKAYKGSDKFTKLALVCDNFEQKREAFLDESSQYGRKSSPDLWAILYAMDDEFCSATKAAARHAWEESFKRKTLSNGINPDQTLLDMYKLCKQRYSDLAEAKEETQHRFEEYIHAQVKHFNDPVCLYELEKLVTSDAFRKMEVTDMVKKMQEFFTSDSQGKRVKDFLYQRAPKPGLGSDSDKRSLEKRINALEAAKQQSPAPPPNPLQPPPINAIGGGSSWKKD